MTRVVVDEEREGEGEGEGRGERGGGDEEEKRGGQGRLKEVVPHKELFFEGKH